MSAIDVPASIKKSSCLRTTTCHKIDQCYYFRGLESVGTDRNRDFHYPKHVLSVSEAVKEGQRCLKCLDPPCQSSCPSQIDVRTFNNAVGEGNFYQAAKTLLTHNPLGWTSGMLCPTNHFCRGGCTLSGTLEGSIHINEVHCVAMDAFMHMKLPQIRDPSIVHQPYHDAKIALIGAGPASLSCASFLARIGYTDVTIFEKGSFAGGTVAIEIPEFRIPYYITRFEVKLVEDLGVKFVFNKALGKDFTIPSLKEEGFQAIFIGVGFPEANVIKQFRVPDSVSNVWTSKRFLAAVADASKPGMNGEKKELPNLKGNVVVVGAGDVAADCSQAAFRCGADFVTLVFRRGIIDMRMNEDEAEGLRREKVELVGCHSPAELKIVDGKATEMVCDLMKKVPHTEKYIKDGDQQHTILFDHIISSFGSQIGKDIYAPVPIDKDKWVLTVNYNTMETPVEGVWAGGDCVGSGTIIEAVNDGKVSSWNIHKYLAQKIGGPTVKIPDQPTDILPFMTPVDLVDLSVNVAGLKFPNSLGVASGPSTENVQMLRRAFQAGFGWAVTKTFQRDVDILPNVSPRTAGCFESNVYENIELNSERKLDYWEKELPKLKKDFPNNIVIASIHSKGDVDTWIDLSKRIEATGVDGLQLNISCPNLGHKADYSKLLNDIVSGIVKSGVKIPLFPKLGPSQGDIVELATVAKEAGASGISGLNTIPGILKVQTNGQLIPQVGFGEDAQVSEGGLSGKAIHPFALAAVAAVTKKIPNFPFLAGGGVESAETAWEFLQLGAPVVQVASAIFSRGFKLTGQEILTGLKFHLYARAREDLREWGSQIPPEVLIGRSKREPFGPYQEKKVKLEIEEVLKEELPQPSKELAQIVFAAKSDTSSNKTDTSTLLPPKLPSEGVGKVEDAVGRSVKRIVDFAQLDVAIKVVSQIDLSRCMNCGSCQQACFDSGYACIVFDKATRTPKVTPMCHGCGLCAAVCPAHCIKMVPKPAKA